MSDENCKMSESEKKKEDWMNSKWRPAMGWLYMAVCAFDFVIFPILWSLLQAFMKVAQVTQWNPLTLQGAGLFHLAMGAVLGLAAWGRTQEKLNGANNGGIQSPGSFGTGFGAPQQNSFGSASNTGFGSTVNNSNSFGAATSNGFGNASSAGGFGRPATTQTQPEVVIGFGGKPGPAPIQDPVL